MAERSKSSGIGILHPKLAATFCLIPIAVGVLAVWLFVCYELLNIRRNEEVIFGIAFASPIFTLYGGFLLIWWRSFKATPRSKFVRLLVSIWLLVFFLLYVIFCLADVADDDWLVFLGAVLGCVGSGVGIMIVAAAGWNPPEGNRIDVPVPCPQCNFDLRNTKTCRCPECERVCTLAELAVTTHLADEIGITSPERLVVDGGECDE